MDDLPRNNSGKIASGHRLDVFSPETVDALRPVLIFMHGGAFVGGNKRTGDSPFYDNVMRWAVKSGMVGVNTTYRLAPAHPFPAAQQDLRAALQWMREHAEGFGGDPRRIVLVGHSAGAAHVAQYVAHREFHVAQDSGLIGAILLSGLFDPASCEPDPPLRAYFGEDNSLYAARSALPGLTSSGIPLLLAYAELDPPDFHRQSQLAQQQLKSCGVCSPLFELTGHSHMSEVFAIGTEDEVLASEMLSFIRGLA